jgi:GT2 family glycosyltransferase
MPITIENFKPEISCIYVNYRSASLLESSLRSLLEHETRVPFEVIVVNNDRNEKKEIDGLCKQYGVECIEAFQNPGFGSAINTGAAKARGEILFFINPDTQWKSALFPIILDILRTNTNIGALGIQLVSPEGVPESTKAGRAFSFPIPPFVSESDNLPGSAWVSGGAMFIPKHIFQEVGGFDECFFMYFEDMDLCLRLQKQGYEIVFQDDCQIIHLGGKSHITKASQKQIYDRSLYLYTKKHWSPFAHFLFRVLHPFYRLTFPYGRK